MNFSTCYIDKSSERAIILDSVGLLWHLHGFIAITEYSEKDDEYLVKYKCIVDDSNYALDETYPAGDQPEVFAHIGDEINLSDLFKLWSYNAFPFSEYPFDFPNILERYKLKVLNNLACNDLSIIISKPGKSYYIYITDGTNEFRLDSPFTYVIHNDEPGNFLFYRNVNSGEKYGNYLVIDYLAAIIFSLRKIFNNKDICLKDVFMKGEDKSRLPVPDIFDGFLDKINTEIARLIEDCDS